MNITRAISKWTWLARMQEACVRFVSAPASARPLAALRIGLCTVLILQALAIGANILDLFAPTHSYVQWQVSEVPVVSTMPRMRWVVEAAAPLGISEATAVRSVYVLYVA